MSKSIENRGSLTIAFLGRIQRPELKQAPYKPGLPALFDKYEANIEKYSGTQKSSIVNRKKDLAKTLDAFDTQIENMISATKDHKAKFEKAHSESIAKYVESDKKYQDAKTKDKDPGVMNGLLKDWITKLAAVAKQDKALQDEKEKANSTFVANLEKMARTFEKESKDIESVTKQLTSAGDTLEAQMKALIQSNKKVAQQKKNNGLADELGEALSMLLQ